MIIIRKYFSINSQLADDMVTIECDHGPIILKKQELSLLPRIFGKLFKPLGNIQKKTLFYDVMIGGKKFGYVALEDGKDTTELEFGFYPEKGTIKTDKTDQYVKNIIEHFIDYARANKFRKISFEADPDFTDVYKELGFENVDNDVELFVKYL